MVNERDFRQDPNYVAPDPEKKKLILKLGTMITDRYLVKYSRTMNTDDPEYWALDEVLTKEEAKFLLSFKKTRVPYDIEDLAKIKEYLLKTHTDSIRQNGNWMSWIRSVQNTGVDYVTGYNEVVESITAEDIKAIAAKVLADNNKLMFFMKPAE
jgi:hypothetical protein